VPSSYSKSFSSSSSSLRVLFDDKGDFADNVNLLLFITFAAANCLSTSFLIFSRTNKREVKVCLPRGTKP
jgi:hypothetical protein